jgi:hypothetical protein
MAVISNFMAANNDYLKRNYVEKIENLNDELDEKMFDNQT